MSMSKHCVFDRVGDFAIVVHSATAPSIAEWNAVMEHYSSFAREMKGILVFTLGGSPSAMQRKQLRDVFEPAKIPLPPTVVLTDSTVARVAITAFNLFFDNRMKAIEPNKAQDALMHLRVPPALYAEMLKRLHTLALTINVQTPSSYVAN
jgi:hypothetical protein